MEISNIETQKIIKLWWEKPSPVQLFDFATELQST